MKFLQDTTLETIDVTLCRHMGCSLMYLMNTRSDIFFSVNTLSQYMEQPRKVHLVTTKHVIRYLKGTLDFLACFSGRGRVCMFFIDGKDKDH
jgi:hypothetical protein